MTTRSVMICPSLEHQRRNGQHQRTASVYKTPKGQMGFKPQMNHKCTSQSKLDICGET